jgi:hypothetical protein
MRRSFERIYSNQAWGQEAGGSGPGSTLAATAELRATLPEIMNKYSIKTVLDAGCGMMVRRWPFCWAGLSGAGVALPGRMWLETAC